MVKLSKKAKCTITFDQDCSSIFNSKTENNLIYRQLRSCKFITQGLIWQSAELKIFNQMFENKHSSGANISSPKRTATFLQVTTTPKFEKYNLPTF